MSYSDKREQALLLLKQYIVKENMINHSLASEAVMRALAKRLGRDEDKWALAGLLHDIDVEITNAEPEVHGKEAVKILRENSYDEDIIEAIRLHNEMSANKTRSEEFHYALASAETITGLIVATTLVYPDKKLASVKPKSVTKRMKEKAFAASVNRDTIMECEKMGIPLEEFAEICVIAMKSISDDIGL